MQNKLLKLILHREVLTPTNDLHRELNILKVNDIFLSNTLTFVNCCLRGDYPVYFRDYYVYRNVTYNLRNNDLFVQRTRTVLGSLASSVQGAKLWNELAENLTHQKLKKNFKKHLVQFYIRTY